jgi:proteasome alpha subunit
MTAPFYVAPEQVMKDRAEYAQKGIARGRSLAAIEFDNGIVFVTENPSRSLHKTSEIYDRIAYAAVGRYSEFESMRVAGIRLADIKGYQYGRADVSAKTLANAYSQALGSIFMSADKPYEVELLVAQVNDDNIEIYHILYDGSIVDEHGTIAIGGKAEELTSALSDEHDPAMSRDDALRLGARALTSIMDTEPQASALEVSGLDRSLGRRRFFRADTEQVAAILGGG